MCNILFLEVICTFSKTRNFWRWLVQRLEKLRQVILPGHWFQTLYLLPFLTTPHCLSYKLQEHWRWWLLLSSSLWTWSLPFVCFCLSFGLLSVRKTTLTFASCSHFCTVASYSVLSTVVQSFHRTQRRRIVHLKTFYPYLFYLVCYLFSVKVSF